MIGIHMDPIRIIPFIPFIIFFLPEKQYTFVVEKLEYTDKQTNEHIQSLHPHPTETTLANVFVFNVLSTFLGTWVNI